MDSYTDSWPHAVQQLDAALQAARGDDSTTAQHAKQAVLRFLLIRSRGLWLYALSHRKALYSALKNLLITVAAIQHDSSEDGLLRAMAAQIRAHC